MESITWLVDKNRLSSVKKVQVRFVASDRRVVCDQTVIQLVIQVVYMSFTAVLPKLLCFLLKKFWNACQVLLKFFLILGMHFNTFLVFFGPNLCAKHLQVPINLLGICCKKALKNILQRKWKKNFNLPSFQGSLKGRFTHHMQLFTYAFHLQQWIRVFKYFFHWGKNLYP
jgi:hypothetical protein